MYITVSIGNSDDRLSQKEWARFVEDMNDFLVDEAGKVHFFGGASTFARWQNVAWIVELKMSVMEVAARIEEIRKRYKQDSAFILFGEGEFR